jgi:hypothetical protein
MNDRNLETAMLIAFANWNSRSAIAGRFTRVARRVNQKQVDRTQEICGPAVIACGLGLVLILSNVIPA